MPLTCRKRRTTNIQLVICNTHNDPNIYSIKNKKSGKNTRAQNVFWVGLHGTTIYGITFVFLHLESVPKVLILKLCGL